MRSSWSKHAMELAKVAMQRSEDPHKKVGACVLGHNNEVLAVAYNGLASGVNVHNSFWKDRDWRRPYIIHAETNCLARIRQGEAKLIACTLLPCSNCAINIIAHGIKEVFFNEMYTRDDKAVEIFDFYGVKCYQLD